MYIHYIFYYWMTMKHTGSCICGNNIYSFEADTLQVGACHCGMCRKWWGSPSMGIHLEEKIDTSGCKSLKWYESSQWGKRWFCSECGSNLFWSMRDESMIVPFIWALDDQSMAEFSEEIFIDQKPWFYFFWNDTVKKTEAEVFAEFWGE